MPFPRNQIRAKTQARPQPPLTLIILGAMALTALLAVAAARGESAPLLQRDTTADQARTDAPEGGFIPPPFSTAHISASVAANLRPDKVLPASYDARTDGYVSPVKNQGSCGACYAFGTAADLESRLLVAGRGTYDLSENNLKECNYQNSSCAGGNQFMTISQVSRNGVALESCDPYVTSDTACNTGCAEPFLVADWLALSGGTLPDPAVIKQYILDYGPVHTTVFAGDETTPAFSAQFNSYDGSGVLYFTGTNTPNHSVFLVGWDDDLAHPGGSGAWIVKNSWGTSWGGPCGYGSSGGYFTIAYGSASIGMYSSVTREFLDADSRLSTLSLDEGGYTSAFSYGGVTLWGLSSLTAAADTYLHRVEFWTTDVTTDVDVSLYGSFNGTSVSNLLTSSLNHSFAEPGYHYVQLAQPLALTAGQTVHVVVKFINQSYTYPLAVDLDGPAASGKSYASYNGSAWTNLATYGADTTIRARVSTDTALAIEDPGPDAPPPAALPLNLRLDAAYPNPFNPSTTVEYTLHRPGFVRLGVHDLKGALVRVLVAGTRDAGTHQVVWDGRDDGGQLVPSGVYFCRADAGSQTDALKLVLLK